MKNVVIIGAGPAGLTAAYHLLKSNNKYNITILEQDSQVGGISKTVSYNGNRIDLGGHRFFSKEKQINDIWLELLQLQGVKISSDLESPQRDKYPGVANPNETDEVMLLRRRVSRIFYDGKFFDYPISINTETLKKLGILKCTQCFWGYMKSCVAHRNENSLEDFYINRFGKPLYEMFFKDYTTKLWGVSPKYLDPSWGAQRVKKISLSNIILENARKLISRDYKTSHTSLIEEFYYPKFGPGQLWETMAKKIEDMGGQILLNASCNRIACDGGNILGVYYTNSKKEATFMQCEYLLSSIPIKNLVSSLELDVPSEIKTISNELPYRDFITVGILVNKLELTNNTLIETKNNLPPDCWIYVQDKKVKMGRIQVFNNWSPFLLNKPAETVWLGLEYFCSENDALWAMTDEDFCNMALKELVDMKIIKPEAVIDKTILRQKKAYPAYFGTYKEFSKIKTYLDNFKNLICIGRNGQHRYNNMDHSMMTAIMAADYICDNTGDKDDIWMVNMEQEYHESGTNS